MEILTATAMRRVDARAIAELGIPGATLMESAGREVADALIAEIPELVTRRVVVFCGKGNNGGDGLVAATHLASAGVAVRAVLLARGSEVSGLAAGALAGARERGVTIAEIADDGAWGRHPMELDRETIVIDAILGTGVRGPARGLVAHAIEAINASGATIVAIDIPSGADADAGRLPGVTIRAHRTYALCRPKPCLVLEPAASHAGRWSVLDIGIPDTAIAAEGSELFWWDEVAAGAVMPVRPADAHKGTLGHLLAVAGSRGKSGAALLLARAALRSGVGLVTVATPRSAQPLVATGQAELMTVPLAETKRGGLGRISAAGQRELLGSRDALALGPGLGTDAAARATVVALLASRTVPAVLDADGLNAFSAEHRPRLRLRAGRHPLVVTPHPGEASRLLGTTVAAIQADRLGCARHLAAETGAVVVLKGRRTVVAHPGGRASFNASGNPGMATGGTGDALTGVIGALLARGLDAFDAARLGTYVHGAAGDLASESFGQDGMIAGDLIDALPSAWRMTADRRRGVGRWTPGA